MGTLSGEATIPFLYARQRRVVLCCALRLSVRLSDSNILGLGATSMLNFHRVLGAT